MITLAEYKYKLKLGDIIIMPKRDGLAFLQHLLEFEPNIVFLVECGDKMKFTIKK